MVAIKKLLWTVVSMASVASAAALLPARSSKITFTVFNKCKHEFAPIFSPPLPGKKTWPTLKSGEYKKYSFYSDTYRGKVFSPLRNASTSTGAGATWGEFDLESGDYDISVANGFNVPMALLLSGRQYENYCQAAVCSSANCKDAYKSNSGLLTASRVGDSTAKPNHNCPPSFTQWSVYFC